LELEVIYDWDVTPCGLIDKYHHTVCIFMGIKRDDGDSIFYMPDYTASHSRWPQRFYLTPQNPQVCIFPMLLDSSPTVALIGPQVYLPTPFPMRSLHYAQWDGKTKTKADKDVDLFEGTIATFYWRNRGRQRITYQYDRPAPGPRFETRICWIRIGSATHFVWTEWRRENFPSCLCRECKPDFLPPPPQRLL
jgi:hypothetical protein